MKLEHQACDAHAAAPPSPQTDPGQGDGGAAPPPASPAGSSVDPFPAFLLLIRSRHDGKRGGILRKPLFRTFGRCGGSNRKTAVSSCGGRKWDKYDREGGVPCPPFSCRLDGPAGGENALWPAFKPSRIGSHNPLTSLWEGCPHPEVTSVFSELIRLLASRCRGQFGR